MSVRVAEYELRSAESSSRRSEDVVNDEGKEPADSMGHRRVSLSGLPVGPPSREARSRRPWGNAQTTPGGDLVIGWARCPTSGAGHAPRSVRNTASGCR